MSAFVYNKEFYIRNKSYFGRVHIVQAMILLSFLVGCAKIEIEETDLSAVAADNPGPGATQSLGEPDAILNREAVSLEYYAINEGYSGKYQPGGFAGTNLSVTNPGPFGLILLPVMTAQLAVMAGEQASQRKSAREGQKAGLVIFRDPAGKIKATVKIRTLVDQNAALTKMANVYAAAKNGDPEALLLFGIGEINDKRRYALICRSSHLGNILAMEFLAGAIRRGKVPKTNKKLDSLFWFALAHTDYVQTLISRLIKAEKQPDTEKEKPSPQSLLADAAFGKYESVKELFPWRQSYRTRFFGAWKYEDRLAALPPEDLSRLIEQLETWKPDPSECPRL